MPQRHQATAQIGIVDTVSDQAGVGLTGRSTLFYNPLADTWRPSSDTDVNYMMLAVKDR